MLASSTRTPTGDTRLDEKYAALRAGLGRMKGVAVAFSGGADSSLLLAVAAEAAGGPVLALTVYSEMTPADEARAATDFAARRGIEHRTVRVDLLDDPAFVSNPPDRCYLCKKRIFTALAREARGLPLAEGTHRDDDADYRPGKLALAELGVASPLAATGLSKKDIRALSVALGLETAGLPAAPCLATRIPYGTTITVGALRTIEHAESFLRGLGFTRVRVRHHGDVARIEVDPASLARLSEEGMSRIVAAELRSLGFTYVAADLEGYRTGSMNESLAKERIVG